MKTIKNAYRGKHPHRIASVGSTRTKGEARITANDGESLLVPAKLTGGRMPKIGEDFNAYKELSAKERERFFLVVEDLARWPDRFDFILDGLFDELGITDREELEEELRAT